MVEELESVAETSGLCRRARKRALRGQIGTHHSEMSDSSGNVDSPSPSLDTKRRVRFVDVGSLASTNRLNSKHAPFATADGRIKSSGLWLVEGNPETGDVLDLSDPRALARHTAAACDAETAKAMTDAFHAAEVSRHKWEAKSHSPFPIVNGRIIIEDTNKHPVFDPGLFLVLLFVSRAVSLDCSEFYIVDYQ